MAMDLNAFLAAALAPREQAVEVPELAAWFAEGEPCSTSSLPSARRRAIPSARLFFSTT